MSSAQPVKKEEKKPSTAVVGYWKLFKYTTKWERFLMFVGLANSTAQGAMMPLFAVVYGIIAYDFAPDKPPEAIKDAASQGAFYMFLLGLGMFLFCFFGTFFWNYVGASLTIRIKKMYFESITGQEVGWFDVVNPESLTIAYVENLTKFKDAVGFKNHILVSAAGTTIIGFLVGYIQGWWFAVIVTLTFPIIMIGMVTFVAVNQRESRISKQAYERAGSVCEQSLGAVKTVKALGGEEHELNLYRNALDEAKKVSIKYGFIAAFCYGLFMLCMTSSFGLNYWLGAILVDKQVNNVNMGRTYNIQDIITIFFAIVNGGFALGQTSPALKALAMGKEAAYNIYEIIERKTKIPLEDPNGIVPESIEGELSFENVHFSYPSRPDTKVLNGVSFVVPKGKKVALVGETGCGKSTTIQMMERYYDPTSGTVKVDGKDLKSYNLRALRKFIGYVGQEPVLFAMSIRENLQIAKPGATQEEMEGALKQANAWNFIQGLEAGLDTYVGSGGSQLSGGQKQRISIARSILQNPKILLLDEATSALDRKNEREIQETLDKFASDRTTVTIAHRLSTIKNSDIIYVFEKGNIVESGTHNELFSKGGYYAKLVNIQIHGLQINQDPNQVNDAEDGNKRGMHDPIPANEGDDFGAEVELKKPLDTEPMPLLLNKEKSHHSAPGTPHNRSSRLTQQIEKEKSRAIEEELEEEKKSVASKRLRVYLKGSYTLLFGGCLFALLSGCVMPVFALFIADMLTVLSKYQVLVAGYGARFGYTWDGVRTETGNIALEFVYIAAFSLVANFIQLGFFNALSQKITLNIRADLFKQYMTRDQEFFDKRENSPGELAAVLAKDCLIVNSVVSTSYGAVLTGIGSFVCGIVIAFYSSWRIALIGLAVSPLLFASGVIKTAKMKGKKQHNDDTNESKTFQETCTNMRTVLALNAFPTIRGMFSEFVEIENKLTFKANSWHSTLESFAQFSTFIIYALIFYCGAIFTLDYNLGFNDLFRSFMGIVFAAFGASMGQQFTENLGEAKVAATKIFEYFDIPNKIRNLPQAVTTPIVGDIEFRHVKFTYPERNQPCFTDLSFKIGAKQKVAFAGPSGTGKSTIFSLLYRFYDPQAGEIYVDGVNIKDYDIAHLRRSLGMVSQEPVLFNDSILYNIKYNRPQITQDEVREATTIANAIKFIERDAGGEEEEKTGFNESDGKGFERKVGLKGSKLSGGQKQRVAIARTVVRKPAVYMFDEATSALDTESEKVVQDAINKISMHNTSLAIAHRISTIRHCDKIFVIEHGKVAEAGTYEELMAMKGVFYQINEAH